eukprot:Gb_17261 [translate_table: standard]
MRGEAVEIDGTETPTSGRKKVSLAAGEDIEWNSLLNGEFEFELNAAHVSPAKCHERFLFADVPRRIGGSLACSLSWTIYHSLLVPASDIPASGST